MKKNKRTILILGSIFVIILLLAAAAVIAVNFSRSWYLSRMPLVQIYSPANHQPLTVGNPSLFHASARSSDGISRLELWVDGVMIESADYGEKGKIAPSAALSSGWSPASVGKHTLIAKAFTPGGIKGQGTVYPEVLPAQPLVEHPRVEFVADGENLESIAAANDTDVETLQELNPGIGGDPLATGDALFVPGGSGSYAGGDDEVPAPPADDPPDEALDEPGLFDGLLYLFAFPLENPSNADDMVSLRVDAQTLRSGSAYESLHCYISMAGSTARWYPDEDNNPSTDESFTQTEGTSWDIASHLGGEDGVIVSWPQNLAIPLAANCVGVTGGGTEAVDLGTINLEIEPAAWDGAAREVTSGGGEDVFVLGYRVVHIGIDNVPKGIDDTMSIPYDLELEGTTLTWQYHPSPSEAPIDGFRIYYNGTLLWITPPDPMQTEIAHEWADPSCVDDNEFTVSAFRYGPDDPESYPSDPLVIEGTWECEREVVVTWQEMTTGELGSVMEERGVVGPAVGYFTADGSRGYGEFNKTIEGTCFGSGICGEFGLQEYDSYDLFELFDYFGGTDSYSDVMILSTGDLRLEYDWWDYDGTLQAKRICAGSYLIPYESLDSTHDITIYSDQGGDCTVTATLDQIRGPVGEGTNAIVLPDLQVGDIVINDDGILSISITNIGLATFPGRDLTLLVESKSTEDSVRYVLPDTEIEPGDAIKVEAPEITFAERPLDVCVTIDPDNEFLDAMDGFGGREPVCGKLPDLYIFDTQYEYHGDRMHIIFYNGGDANLVDESIELAITAHDGTQFRPVDVLQNISIPKEQFRDISFPLNGIRDQLAGGYTITVDPNNEIDEKREDNNTREVDPPVRLQVTWTQLFFPHFDGVDVEPQIHEYNMQLMAKSTDERSLENWATGQYQAEPSNTSDIQPNRTVELVLASDEQLEVEVAGQILDGDNRIDLGRVNELFDRLENYGAPPGVHPAGDCAYLDSGEHIWRIFPPGEIGEINAPWVVEFTICRLE